MLDHVNTLYSSSQSNLSHTRPSDVKESQHTVDQIPAQVSIFETDDVDQARGSDFVFEKGHALVDEATAATADESDGQLSSFSENSVLPSLSVIVEERDIEESTGVWHQRAEVIGATKRCLVGVKSNNESRDVEVLISSTQAHEWTGQLELSRNRPAKAAAAFEEALLERDAPVNPGSSPNAVSNPCSTLRSNYRAIIGLVETSLFAGKFQRIFQMYQKQWLIVANLTTLKDNHNRFYQVL